MPELQAAGDGGYDADFCVRGNRGGEPVQVANVFFANKNVDVLARLAGFGEDAVAQTGIGEEKGLETFEKARARAHFDFDFGLLGCEFAKRAGDVEGNEH